MKKHQTLPVTDHSVARSGFTLVEMLVSVALVLLMMSMFAAIFQLAAESTSTQRGISENDQRARSVTTTVRNDLDKRTMRNAIAFQANEDANSTPTRFEDRTGFLEIITNDPANGIDDTLLLTVSTDMQQKDTDETPYSGHSEFLQSTIAANNSLVNNPNQPEMDDGIISPNSTASSKAAQIAYFVRNGNLYRRVMLLREPRERAGRELNPQPTFQDGSDPFAAASYFTSDHPPTAPAPNGTNAFWRDFDFSAIRVGGLAQFVGIESLNNAPGSTFFTVAKPHFRYGHSSTAAPGLPPGPAGWTGGFPRQFTTVNPALLPEFFGFFLQEETSFPSVIATMPTGGFTYPHGNAQLIGTTTPITAVGSAGIPGPASAAENGDPMDIRANLTLNARKVVSEFTDASGAGGSRRSEDLLLSNVHEFRIEIWDDRLSEWVYPGHNRTSGGVLGDYHVSRRYNAGYGPFGPASITRAAAGLAATDWNFTNHVFDTWHPDAVSGAPGSASMPPFRPMTLYPPFRPDDSVEAETAPFWAPSSIPDFSDLSTASFQTYTTEDTNGNGVLDAGEDADGDGILGPVVFARTEDLNGDGDAADTVAGNVEDGWYDATSFATTTNGGVLDNELYAAVPAPPFGYGYYYRLVRSGIAANGPPNWQARPGALITDDNFVGGTQPPGTTTAVWQAVPNLRPLRSVRITVRFVDQSSQQMRQSTIIHSLVD